MDDSHDRQVFKIGMSVRFAVQIPDDSVGISGSRCSNCRGKAAYCDHICRSCWMPFVGPSGFPQLPKWRQMTETERREIVEEVYCHGTNYGRIRYVNVLAIPLSAKELRKVEALTGHDAELFLHAHGVAPTKLREKLAA